MSGRAWDWYERACGMGGCGHGYHRQAPQAAAAAAAAAAPTWLLLLALLTLLPKPADAATRRAQPAGCSK